MRVVTYNVHSCVGLDTRLSPERIADVLAELCPDIVALQEVDVHTRRGKGKDQAELIAARLGMNVQFQPCRTLGDGFYGNAVLSRFPLQLMRAGLFRQLPALERRGAVWVRVDTPAGPVQVLNTHLGLLRRERMGQLEELLSPSWIGHAEQCGPVVLAGDFNSTPRSPEYRRLSGRLVDATVGTRARTFPGAAPLWQLDHLFTCGNLRRSGLQVGMSKLARAASDHLPLLVELTGSGTAVGSA